MGEPERYPVQIFVSAPTGYVRAAQGLIGRALREALKIKKWRELPHYVHTIPGGWVAEATHLPPQYSASMTMAEWRRFHDVAGRLGIEEGWGGAPMETFGDSVPLGEFD